MAGSEQSGTALRITTYISFWGGRDLPQILLSTVTGIYEILAGCLVMHSYPT